MSTAVTSIEAPAAADPRMAAFLARDCPEVFHSVTSPTAIWKADAYAVEDRRTGTAVSAGRPVADWARPVVGGATGVSPRSVRN